MKEARSMICFIVALHLTLAVPLVRCQEKDTLPTRIFNDIVSSINFSSTSKPNTSFISLNITRIKREDDVDTFPTRHAKHRRKRRCKNRPVCSRLVTSQQKLPETQQSNNYEIDRSITKNRTFNDRDENFNIQSEEIDMYNERFIVDGYSEAKDDVTIDDYADGTDLGSVTIPVDDLSTLLTRLFQILRNTSVEDSREILKELNFVGETVDEDPCQKWLNSKDKLEEAFLGPLVALPACPCQYPSNIFYDDKLWDEKQQKHFRWRDVSGESHRLDVYKPGAAYCVRSLLAQGSGSAAAQHCCYDRQRRLITRGSGAGTPNFVSPEISIALHEKIDILPWRLCKGDFSRFNKVRPPNNDNGCDDNPDNEEYQRQINNTKYY
ncbi:hypothetical protein KPH14_012118 [Odynerus spinipes]|uniref:AMOP domain-containing protein n=1 Tax=Odynerus spinipes TaxID=1348599 RepID=A0AAD9R9P7_9HYME|nr:hypothetical protein KPH14_012118 [Odynerus spinipes]